MYNNTFRITDLGKWTQLFDKHITKTKTLHSPNNTEYEFSNVPKHCECPSSLRLNQNRCHGENLAHKTY
jgi:hypothetical protein